MIARLLLLLTCFYISSLAFATASIPSHAVVLMYHRFDENKYPTTNIKKEQFIEQLDYLKKRGTKFWRLEKIVEYLKEKKPIPDKVVALTIDDAYLSVYEVAFPILKKRKIPFTVFVSTRFLDKGYSSYMSWDQLKEMSLNGATVGNHSESHNHLIAREKGELYDAWLTRIAEDVLAAEFRIQEKTGISTTLFAYPYGEYNNALMNYMGKLGYTAFGQHSGAIGENSDFRALPRFPISENFSNMLAFKNKVNSLPMPVMSVYPLDSVTLLSMPQIIVHLDKKLQPEKHSLQCYASGQGTIKATWIDGERFRARATQPLTERRSRYNCTVRDKESGRFYWFSHMWIKPQIPEQ